MFKLKIWNCFIVKLIAVFLISLFYCLSGFNSNNFKKLINLYEIDVN